MRLTGLTLVTGWWGFISFFINWMVLLSNVVNVLPALFLPAAFPPGSTQPSLNQAELNLIAAYHQEIITLLNRGTSPYLLVQEIAEKAGVSEAKVVLYILATTARPAS